MNTEKVFSYGGGVQSTAALVLAATGRLDYRTFLFANVGEDSENPATLVYLTEHARPFAESHGLDLIELRRTMRNGSTRTLRQEIENYPRSIPIPVRLNGGGFGWRKCTDRFKIQVVAKWTKTHGATPENPTTCAIGYSVDEISRANTLERVAWQVTEYPLIDRGISRADCHKIIAEAGLPDPPKSACTFCPFHNREDWRRQARNQPEVFADSVAMEEMLGRRREGLGKDRAWFSSIMAPLPGVMDQGSLFGDDDEATCDSGSCFT